MRLCFGVLGSSEFRILCSSSFDFGPLLMWVSSSHSRRGLLYALSFPPFTGGIELRDLIHGMKEVYDKTQAQVFSNYPVGGYVYVELLEIRKDVQCPICLGIIKKTRTVMECLHRFCRECIDKS
ncbi:hypothetical protein PIB30_055243, partial [Stylosanthes scabra]|nr:hypothetical protein [Stylosanthes scabra]